MKKTSKRNWIVASLLSITLTFGFLFGLQPSKEVKVTHAVDYSNALSSEIKIELNNVAGQPSTTFENGRYLHINPAYKTISTNDNSLGADMEYDSSTGVLKVYDTQNIGDYDRYISLYGLNEESKNLTIELHKSLDFYNLGFEKGNLTITSDPNSDKSYSTSWQNRVKVTGTFTIRGNVSVNVTLSNTGYNYDVNNLIEADILQLLDNAELRHTASKNQKYYASIYVNSIVLNTTGELYISVYKENSITTALYTYSVTLTKCKMITLVSSSQYESNLTNSSYLLNAATTPIDGYFADIATDGDQYEGYYLTYRLISDSQYFNVSFDSNNGSGTMNPVSNVQGYFTLPECSFIPPEYEQDLEFRYWSDDYSSSTAKKYSEGSSYFLYKNIKFYAIWNIATNHQVSFDANGGQGNMPGGSYKGKYPLPSCSFIAPTGKQFKCWALNSASGTQYNAQANYYLYKDVTFYAIWEDALTEYIVNYSSGEGQGSGDLDYVVAGTQIALQSPENVSCYPIDGKEFDAWSIGGNRYNPGDLYTVNADTYITALWKDIPAEVLTGTVTITGTLKYGKTLTATVTDTNNTGTLSYQWRRNGEPISSANSNTYLVIEDDIGYTLSVVVTSSVETGSIVGTASNSISKADGPAAPTGISATACTTEANNDGVLKGVTTEMEYKLSTLSGWADGTGSDITNLVSGTYNVRYKETATHEAGEIANVVVNEYNAPVLYSVTVNKGTANPVSAVAGTTITITADAPEVGYVFDKWVSTSGVVFADASSETTTFTMIEGNVTVTATYKPAVSPTPAPSNSGLGGGAIAGIVIGSVLVAGLGGFALVWFVIKKKTWADFIALFKKK